MQTKIEITCDPQGAIFIAEFIEKAYGFGGTETVHITGLHFPPPPPNCDVLIILKKARAKRK